jgi:hypothetical protein
MQRAAAVVIKQLLAALDESSQVSTIEVACAAMGAMADLDELNSNSYKSLCTLLRCLKGCFDCHAALRGMGDSAEKILEAMRQRRSRRRARH